MCYSCLLCRFIFLLNLMGFELWFYRYAELRHKKDRVEMGYCCYNPSSASSHLLVINFSQQLKSLNFPHQVNSIVPTAFISLFFVKFISNDFSPCYPFLTSKKSLLMAYLC